MHITSNKVYYCALTYYVYTCSQQCTTMSSWCIHARGCMPQSKKSATMQQPATKKNKNQARHSTWLSSAMVMQEVGGGGEAEDFTIIPKSSTRPIFLKEKSIHFFGSLGVLKWVWVRCRRVCNGNALQMGIDIIC